VLQLLQSEPSATSLTLMQNLMSLEWRPKKVEASGNLQFEATDASGTPRVAVALHHDDGNNGGFQATFL
jgi:hypothetical protein